LVSKSKEAGADSVELPDTYSLAAGSHADVLILPETEEEGRLAPLKPAPHTCGELQEDIASLRDELKDFGSQLENLSSLSSKSLHFVPSSRVGEQGAAAEQEGEQDVDMSREASDKAMALEVAKRSSWYRAPPSELPEGCEMISVRQQIELRPVSELSDRPRSSHPCLLAGTSTSMDGFRPSTAPCIGARPLSSLGRPPSSHEEAVAQRLGYAIDEEGQLGGPSGRSPKKSPLGGSLAGTSLLECVEEEVTGVAHLSELKPQEITEASNVEKFSYAYEEEVEPAHLSEPQEKEITEAPNVEKFPMPPLEADDPADLEFQLPELPDLGMDPFSNASVTFNVT